MNEKMSTPESIRYWH